jgi:general secretion pathway protein G
MQRSGFFLLFGFTLLELMIVIFIISILAAVVAPKLLRRPEQARLMKVKYDLLMLKNSLDLYRLDHGVYPSTVSGLKALLATKVASPQTNTWQDNGYLDELPLDPWGQLYQYSNDHGQLTIASLGPQAARQLSSEWRRQYLQLHSTY